MNDQITTAKIEADPIVPVIHIYRDFRATPAQLVRAHIDPELIPLWMGPDNRTLEVDYWDARSGGNWRDDPRVPSRRRGELSRSARGRHTVVASAAG